MKKVTTTDAIAIMAVLSCILMFLHIYFPYEWLIIIAYCLQFSIISASRDLGKDIKNIRHVMDLLINTLYPNKKEDDVTE